MRRLTRSETRLLTLFSAAVFVAANLFAIQYGMRSRAKVLREIGELQNRIADDRSWITLAEDFTAQRAWLAANAPPVISPDQANTALIRLVRETAEAQGLTVTEESLLPPDATAGFANVNLQLKLSGAFPGLIHLLFELQKPGAWRSVEKLNVKSDSTPPNVLVEMQLRQYFSTATPPAPSTQP